MLAATSTSFLREASRRSQAWRWCSFPTLSNQFARKEARKRDEEGELMPNTSTKLSVRTTGSRLELFHNDFEALKETIFLVGTVRFYHETGNGKEK